MFVSDGSLLIPTDNASIIHAVEEANPIRTQTPTEAIIQAPHGGLLNILSNDSVLHHDHVNIIDSMTVVQGMDKSPGMKKIINFKDAFVKRITWMVKPYDEGRIIFDRYDTTQSRKRKTGGKRAQGNKEKSRILATTFANLQFGSPSNLLTFT